MNLILFDIDGTLTRSDGVAKKAFDQVFSRLYQVENVSQSLSFAGKTDPMIIQEIFVSHLGRKPAAEESSKVKEAYVNVTQNDTAQGQSYKPLEGIELVLETLQALPNTFLGLATGNFEETAYMKLRCANLDHFFSYGGFGSDSHIRPELTRIGIERGKSLLPKDSYASKIVVIGDTVHDITSGKESNAITVGIISGATSRESFEEFEADYIFDHYNIEDFLKILN